MSAPDCAQGLTKESSCAHWGVHRCEEYGAGPGGYRCSGLCELYRAWGAACRFHHVQSDAAGAPEDMLPPVSRAHRAPRPHPERTRQLAPSVGGRHFISNVMLLILWTAPAGNEIAALRINKPQATFEIEGSDRTTRPCVVISGQQPRTS